MRAPSICLPLAIVLVCPVASAQWVQQNSGTGARLKGASSVDQTTGWVSGYELGCVVLKTFNGGANWTRKGVLEEWTLERIHFLDSSTGIAVGGKWDLGSYGGGTAGAVILRTTDGGTSWGIVSSDSTQYLTSVTFSDTANGWAVGGNDQYRVKLWDSSSAIILHTSDAGNTWIVQYEDSLVGSSIQFQSVSFIDSENGTVVGGRRILRTTNGGATWTRQASWTDTTSLFFLHVRFLNTNTGFVFGHGWVGEEFGHILLRTTNGGETWTSQQISALVHDAAFSDAHTGIAVGDNGAILRTTNGGADWAMQQSGTTNHLFGVAFVDVNTGTVVGDSGTILRTTNGGVTWVEGEQQHGVPQQYLLCQNYPNPFNPSTTIRYESPKSSMVRLSVVDILGREVSVLVNERKNAGSYEVRFDGSGLASGVYLYRIQAGDFVQTKKLVLLQ